MTKHPSEGLDLRRRRILFRAWHRGTREMDLVMGRFCDAKLANLPDSELDDLEALLEAPDHDVFDWVSGAALVSGHYDTSLFRRLRTFHTRDASVDR